jgi:hypothetical protein
MAIFKIQYANVKAKARIIDRNPNKHGGTCSTCGGRTIRSRTTGTIHKDCFSCRYLKMIYGPSIEVSRVDK